MSDYTDIQQELDDFKNAVYGEEVRDSMVSAIKKIHDIAESAADAPDASTATAGQAPIADGQGGWAWGDMETGDSVPTNVRQAIFNLLNNAVYRNTDLQNEKAIIQSWASEVTSISVSPATLSMNGAEAEQLVVITQPAGGLVTWESSDTSVAEVDGGLVTSIGNGTCTITARCGSKSATCAVTVSGFATLLSIDAVYTQSGTVYDDDSLDSLKSDLVVTANYDDDRSVPVTDYTLQGELTVGTSTIVVVYGGKTTTFSVTVTQSLPTGYTKLAYVSANGSQYVDIGLNETQVASAEYEISVATGKSGSYQTNGFHILSSSNNYFPFFKGSQGNTSSCDVLMIYRAGNESGINGFLWEYNKKYSVSAYVGGTDSIKIDDVEVRSLTAGASVSASNPYKLFTYGGGDNVKYRFWGNLYTMKIYDANGNLVRNLIPAKNSSNVAGLYDIVNDVFYTSATNTALIAGEVA